MSKKKARLNLLITPSLTLLIICACIVGCGENPGTSPGDGFYDDRTVLIPPEPYDPKRPVWSPDCRLIAFEGCYPGDVRDRRLYVYELGSGEFRCLTDTLYQPKPQDWSSDGKWISYSDGHGYYNVYITRPDGSDNTMIYEGLFGGSFSPGGTEIAFGSGPTLTVADISGFPDIEYRSIGGRAPDGPAYHWYGAYWGPDGEHIFQVLTVGGWDYGPVKQYLFFTDPGGEVWEEAFELDDSFGSLLGWSPGGEYLLMTRYYKDYESVWTCDVKTGGLYQLTGNNDELLDSIVGADWGDNDTIAFAVCNFWKWLDYPDGPANTIYTVDGP